jgi:hypothetical protein
MKAKIVKENLNERHEPVKRPIPTVHDLIEKLNEFPPHMPIGFTDHFGDYVELDLRDIYEGKCANIKGGTIVHFPLPDIGPEPD